MINTNVRTNPMGRGSKCPEDFVMRSKPIDVAAWMVRFFMQNGYLHRDVAVSGIIQNFDEKYIVIYTDLNCRIRSDVLRYFRELTGNEVVWCQGYRMWRLRGAQDLPGRRQP